MDLSSSFYTLPSEEALTNLYGQRHHTPNIITMTGGGSGGYSLTADGYNTKSLEVANELCLYNSRVLESLKANEILCFDCSALGNLTAASSIALVNCSQVGSIVNTPELLLKNSHVYGDVKGGIIKLINTVIDGSLTAACQEVKILNSQVNKLAVNKPISRFTILSARGEEVEGVSPELAPLVEAVQKGKARITHMGSVYHLDFRSKNTGITCSSTFDGGKVKVTSNDTCIMNGRIHVAGLSFEQKTLSKVQNLQQVLSIVEKAKHNELPTKSEASATQRPQIVIVNGGHIQEVIFEIPGGIVICENGGSVGSIIQGIMGSTNDVKELIEEEPPENFLDPIYFEVMKNPYRTPLNHQDHVYDYRTLERITNKDTGKFIDPQTRIIYELSDCKADEKLKAEILEWLTTHKPK